MKKHYFPRRVSAGIATLVGTFLAGPCLAQPATDAVAYDADDIGGTVHSADGPEAGVWVIAETDDLPTGYRKIVVTDEAGRYLIPDLPDAEYDVWVRGYGLVDSQKVQAEPGHLLNLTATIAPTPQAAAQYFPSNYWYSLLEPPPRSDFPGTGVSGNGIAIGLDSQQHWIGQMKSGAIGGGCTVCHQLGNKATREIPESLGNFESTVAAWDRRVQSGQSGASMTAAMSRFGRERALEMYADWTDRIAAGEVPPTPPRPEGLERNVVITQWDWADRRGFVHDTVSTDKRNPTLNANGLVYGVQEFGTPDLNILDPVRNSLTRIAAPVRDQDTPFTHPQFVFQPSAHNGDEVVWSGKASLHNPMMDHLGRVWLTHAIRAPQTPDFCREGSDHPSAQLYPMTTSNRHLSVYDPETSEFTLIDTCFGTHHLQIAEDADNTVWASNPGSPVLGWLNMREFDETGDAEHSQGWCPYILDTNGNGRQDAYVEPNQPIDPTLDARIEGGSYGIVPSSVDNSVWVAQGYNVPGAIIRLDPGPNPPMTCLAEVYEPPFNNPASTINGFTPRGIDIDRNGVIWTALAGSGHFASFDRRKCEVLNGPAATGQHCPEGWTLYETPGPHFKGVNDSGSADMLYYNWVDQYGALGLGENIPIATGTGSDSLLVLPPDSDFVVMRVPYPMGFSTRGVDGRIDDPDGGWKGRGLWANYAIHASWHIEGGRGATSKAVKFQLRPDPLAR
jgi:hypothetical protein